MDFSKFVDLLDSYCLYFSRLSILRQLDPYEGSLVPFDYRYEKGETSKIVKELDEGLSNDTFVNCWCLSDVESAALWKLFSKNDEGIAIKSTVARLQESITHFDEHCNTTIILTAVEYGHERVRSRKNNSSNFVSGDDVVFTKRRCFEHEKELRLAIYTSDSTPLVTPDETGLKLKVNLECMISEVLIGPEAPCWMVDLVKSVAKKYGFSFKIRPSTLLKLTF